MTYFLKYVHQGAVCPVWKQKCLQSFDSSSPGRELDACLWSLTEVLKRLLKGAHTGTVTFCTAKVIVYKLNEAYEALCHRNRLRC